jgi:hypothetical protein
MPKTLGDRENGNFVRAWSLDFSGRNNYRERDKIFLERTCRRQWLRRFSGSAVRCLATGFVFAARHRARFLAW